MIIHEMRELSRTATYVFKLSPTLGTAFSWPALAEVIRQMSLAVPQGGRFRGGGRGIMRVVHSHTFA